MWTCETASAIFIHCSFLPESTREKMKLNDFFFVDIMSCLMGDKFVQKSFISLLRFFVPYVYFEFLFGEIYIFQIFIFVNRM